MDMQSSDFVGLLWALLALVGLGSEVNGQRRSRWSEGDLRLVGGRAPNEGTVLIYHWSRWGAVCDDYWDIRDATVVCNEMGFPGASQAPRRSRFGKGRRRVWLGGLQCRGTEAQLTMCHSRGWGRVLRRCRPYYTSAGVVCNPRPSTASTSPRTFPSTRKRTPRPSTTSTTTTPTTTTIAATTTTTTTPKPSTAVATTTSSTKGTTSPSQYRVWIYDRDSWRYYMYFRDGSHITSRPDPRYSDQPRRSTAEPPVTTTTRKPVSTTDNSFLNVIAGANTHSRGRNEGRNNIGNIIQIPRTNNHLHNEVVVEKKTDRIVSTGRSEDEAPPTMTPSPAPNYIEYRLKGGREFKGHAEGRLEVRLPGQFKWGVICGDNWDIKGAIVACRHMGVGSAQTVRTHDVYGGSRMDKALARVKCTGREKRLEDCSIATTEETPGKEACSRPTSVAGVTCVELLPDLEPDVRLLETSVYMEDRYLSALQCAQEENCLSASANDLFRNRGWGFMYLTRRLLRFSTVAKNIGTADFRPRSDPAQWEWHACHQHYHSMEAFSHYDIIDKHGNKIADGLKASFCLEDSQCNPGVRRQYNCQHWKQGISVGCSDHYLANIDCQWIDVTDVKPGQYTFKMELNPSLKVAELNYDNNVVKCTLYLSRTRAWMYDCNLTSLL